MPGLRAPTEWQQQLIDAADRLKVEIEPPEGWQRVPEDWTVQPGSYRRPVIQLSKNKRMDEDCFVDLKRHGNKIRMMNFWAPAVKVNGDPGFFHMSPSEKTFLETYAKLGWLWEKTNPT